MAETVIADGKRELVVTVHYRFAPPAAPDSRSSLATGINRDSRGNASDEAAPLEV